MSPVGPNVRQTNFSGGELDKLLHGRTDLPIFRTGLRTCRNFFITKSGAAMSRPGSTFVRETKFPDPPTGIFEDRYGRVRLVSFVASDTHSYVLEIGSGYIRFHRLGGTVEQPAGTPYELTTYVDINGATQAIPWGWTSLFVMTFAQVGDVVTMTHPTSPAMELRRTGHTDWSLREVKFSRPAAEWPDVGASVMENPFDPIGPTTVTTTPFMLQEPLPTADADHPEQEWVWLVTALMQDIATGETFESVGTVVSQSTDGTETFPTNPPDRNDLTTHSVCLYPDKAVTLIRLEVAILPAVYRTHAFLIYRGRGDVFGYVGTTRSRTFVDVGAEPDYTIQPPIGQQPFKVLNQDGTLNRTEYPSAVGFFQERRAFAGTRDSNAVVRRGSDIWYSATGDYYNFDERLATDIAGEPLHFALACTKREEIRHLVECDNWHVVLSNSTARAIGGQQGHPLDFDAIASPVVDKVGSAYVTPQVVDESVLFVRTKGTGARALVPIGGEKPFRGFDISTHAQHLFTGMSRTIVDWAYAEDPYGVVWAVREDGALLSLTFQREPYQAAWARHDTDGYYEAVCSVPEGEEDAVYVAVRRNINGADVRYIERLTSRVRRVLEDDEDPVYTSSPTVTDVNTIWPTDVCADCCLPYAGAPTTTLTGLDELEGKDVYVLARGSAVIGPLTVTAGAIELDAMPEANTVDLITGLPIWVAHVGLAFQADLETLAIRGGEATLREKTVVSVGFELVEARGAEAGQDFEHLDTWDQRDVGDGYGPISAATTLLRSPVDNTWDDAARACLRQSLPLPITVVGITRELALED